MDALCATYRALAARTGKAEPVVHALLLVYAFCLFLAALLNVFSPSWASRNSSPFSSTHSSLYYPSYSIPFYPQSFTRATVNPDIPNTVTSTVNSLRNKFSSSSSALSSSSHLYTPDDGRAISRCVTRGLLLDLLDDPVVNRVRTEMACGCRIPSVYEPHESPKVSAIIQSFNHVDNVELIATTLISNPAIGEVIVCEDGSTDGSLDKWTESLRGVKHFIILSNNLHEVRCYNRAMRLSSAQYFILMQDDDVPPNAPPVDIDDQKDKVTNWVSHATTLFEADPKLGVLSGFIGQLWDHEGSGKGFEFGEQTSDHGGKRQGKTYRIPFLNSKTKNPFMYCECAWAAPLFIRAEALNRVGGLDVGLFGVREPGVWQDCVLSYASWTAGWRVGVYDAKFLRGVGGHGSTRSSEKTKMRDTVWQRAKAACDSRYDRAYIHSHIVMLNNQTLIDRFENMTS